MTIRDILSQIVYLQVHVLLSRIIKPSSVNVHPEIEVPFPRGITQKTFKRFHSLKERHNRLCMYFIIRHL